MLFSHSGEGQWSSQNVFTIGNISANLTTTVQCVSTHLTSFAVLVDVAGGLKVRVLVIIIAGYHSHNFEVSVLYVVDELCIHFSFPVESKLLLQCLFTAISLIRI